MRTKYVLTLIGAALIATCASAEPNVTEKRSSAVSSIDVLGHAGPKLKPSEYSRLPGLYQLDDGRVLEVTMENRKLYAQLGGAKIEIFPSGLNRFVSRDEAVRLKFDNVGYPVDVTLDLARSHAVTKG